MSRAEAWRAARVQEITLTNGLSAQITRPTLMQLATYGMEVLKEDVGQLPKKRIGVKRVQEIMEQTDGDPDRNYDLSLQLVRNHVTDPKLYEGDGECPEDQVTEDDLGAGGVIELGAMIAQTAFALSPGLQEVAEGAVRFREDSDGDAAQ